MSTLNLHEATLAALAELEHMSDAELIAALEECSNGPLTYAFETWSHHGFGSVKTGIAARYELNDRELIRSWKGFDRAKVMDKQLNFGPFDVAANDAIYLLAA